jgi:hypothetical protein
VPKGMGDSLLGRGEAHSDFSIAILGDDSGVLIGEEALDKKGKLGLVGDGGPTGEPVIGSVNVLPGDFIMTGLAEREQFSPKRGKYVGVP